MEVRLDLVAVANKVRLYSRSVSQDGRLALVHTETCRLHSQVFVSTTACHGALGPMKNVS